MNKRIIFDIVLLGAVLFTPWWCVAILGFMGAFLWPSYYEILVAGILVDLLYGGTTLPLRGILGLVGAVVIFFSATYAKKVVR
ncbi:MAG: hypothetical protein WAZ40_01970 [Minisyncoccia bacterium]